MPMTRVSELVRKDLPGADPVPPRRDGSVHVPPRRPPEPLPHPDPRSGVDGQMLKRFFDAADMVFWS